MAVVMMGGDENKPILHDFLGMNCGDPTLPSGCTKSGEKRAFEAEAEASPSVAGSSGGHCLVSGSSDLGSERQGVINSEVFHFHGRKNAISGPETSSTFSRRKRSDLDSAYMGLTRDRMLLVGSDSPESSRLVKMTGKEVVGEQLRRSHDDEMLFSMQPPPRPTSSLTLHPPITSRPDSLISKWERSLPTNPGSMVHYPSRFGQIGTYMDKLSSSYTYRDVTAGTAIISQAAADEGSRTGIKGSGIMNLINPSSGAGERNLTAVLPCSNRPRIPQTFEPESSSVPGRHSIASNSRQMTIFYAGQAHVFDDVNPNKADVIMALAGSNGGSWSTTYSPKKSNVHPPISEAKAPGRGTETLTNNSPLVMQGNLECGLRQVARVPVASDLQSLILGGHQGSRAFRDARLTIPESGTDMEVKRDI